MRYCGESGKQRSRSTKEEAAVPAVSIYDC